MGHRHTHTQTFTDDVGKSVQMCFSREAVWVTDTQTVTDDVGKSVQLCFSRKAVWVTDTHTHKLLLMTWVSLYRCAFRVRLYGSQTHTHTQSVTDDVGKSVQMCFSREAVWVTDTQTVTDDVGKSVQLCFSRKAVWVTDTHTHKLLLMTWVSLYRCAFRVRLYGSQTHTHTQSVTDDVGKSVQMCFSRKAVWVTDTHTQTFTDDVGKYMYRCVLGGYQRLLMTWLSLY